MSQPLPHHRRVLADRSVPYVCFETTAIAVKAIRGSTAVFWTAASLLTAAPAWSQTSQNFDAPGTAWASAAHNNPPGPAVVPGGPTGAFLRLAFGDAIPPNHNTVGFARTDTGPACTLVAELDFRITPGTGRADGLAVAFLDTGAFGKEGAVAPLSVTEEPDFTRSLGIGFDVYENADIGDLNNNHLSVHFDRVRITQIDAGPVDLASGGFIHARIDVDLQQAVLSVTLTPDGSADVEVISDLAIPGLVPYESRLHLGARSGGLTADHDIDNLEVTFGSCPPSLVGSWSPTAPWPVVAIHTHLLPNGKVMFWDRQDVPDGELRARAGTAELGHHAVGGSTTPWLFDPVTLQLTAARPPSGYDLFCTGHTLLADGRLHVAGGHIVDNVGLASAAIYDPLADDWTSLADMDAGRWYPTSTVLDNGDVLVISGDVDLSVGVNTLPEVWSAETGSWRALPNARKALPLYPYMYLGPDGRVFTAGPQQESCFLDTTGTGAWSGCSASGFGNRDYGSSVILDDGRVLIIGGGITPTNRVEAIDLSAATPVWTELEAMAYRRRQLNATLLPDGTVLATGGTSASGFNNATGAVYTAELWQPATGSWNRLAAMAETRIYHSTALLLPDGRVLSAGGGHPNDAANGDPNHFDYEIFSPPYLFRGPQPTITSAPERVSYGETFVIDTPDAAAITRVTWLRLGSVTHAFNQSQRINRLAFAVVDGKLQATAPDDPRQCPPGHYMLFLLNASGVPSVAKIVHVLPALFRDGFESGTLGAWSSNHADPP